MQSAHGLLSADASPALRAKHLSPQHSLPTATVYCCASLPILLRFTFPLFHPKPAIFSLFSAIIALRPCWIGFSQCKSGYNQFRAGLRQYQFGLRQSLIRLRQPLTGLRLYQIRLRQPLIGLRLYQIGLRQSLIGLRPYQIRLRQPRVCLRLYLTGLRQSLIGLRFPIIHSHFRIIHPRLPTTQNLPARIRPIRPISTFSYPHILTSLADVCLFTHTNSIITYIYGSSVSTQPKADCLTRKANYGAGHYL